MMKKLLFILSAVGMLYSAKAQELPKTSPLGSTAQRVGLTDITIEYSRPGVKGRTIFGDLVPFDKVWRTGANAATKINFSSDVKINGSDLKAGEYSLFTIPGENEWTIIINSNTNLWGSYSYNEDEDVLRTNVKNSEGSFVESMRFSFEDISENKANITFAWGTTQVNIPIEVETATLKEKNVEKALREAGRTYRNAANYYADINKYETAIEYADLAVTVNPTNWYTSWVKAEILAKSGDYKAAAKQAKSAIEVGDAYYAENGREFKDKSSLEEEMKEWKSMK